MKTMQLTKVNSAGAEFPVNISRLHVEYVEKAPGELTVIRTSSAYVFVKESLAEVLRKLEG
jgi:uncharacterized protein YlzI (FlbEa/FlbD family)